MLKRSLEAQMGAGQRPRVTWPQVGLNDLQQRDRGARAELLFCGGALSRLLGSGGAGIKQPFAAKLAKRIFSFSKPSPIPLFPKLTTRISKRPTPLAP